MILPLEQWNLGYQQILRDCRLSSSSSSTNANDDHPDANTTSTGGTTLLLCGMDCDAMCAARILSYCLRAEGVRYQLRPCYSYGALDSILRNLSPPPSGDGANGDDDAHQDDEDDGEEGDDDVRAVILLNLGCGRNLTTLTRKYHRLFRKATLYVFDHHRPVHLANVHAGREVVVFVAEEDLCGGNGEGGGVPSDGDGLSGSSSEDEDDEEGDDSSSSSSDDDDESEEEEEGATSDEENEFDDDEDGASGDGTTPRKKRRRRAGGANDGADYDGDEDANAEDAEDAEDDDATAATAPTVATTQSTSLTQSQSQSQQSAGPSFEELISDRRRRISRYYSSGTYHSAPTSWMAYTLSHRQLRFSSVSSLLWLGCVGVTDAYLHGRLDTTGYAVLAKDLRDEVGRVFPNDPIDRAADAVFAYEPDQSGEDVIRTQISTAEGGKILCEDEFDFALLRHWSLYESMVHSNSVCTKLQCYRPGGRQKLREMLARMGLPLEECRQSFAFMRPKLRRRLKDKIEEHAEEYGLQHVSYTGFVRVTGYKSLLSASDMSYAVTALLECVTPAVATKSPAGAAISPDHNDSTSAEGGDNDDDDNSTSQSTRDEEGELLRSFNIAYDALNPKSSCSAPTDEAAEGYDMSTLVNGGEISSGSTGLGAGIRLAMSLQRSIVATAVSLVDKNAIVRLNHFRYAYLHAGASSSSSSGDGGGPSSSSVVTPDGTSARQRTQQHHVFARPLALCKLAIFLMDMHRENGKWTGAKSRPLVLLAEKPRSGTYLVAGYNYVENHGDVSRNRFGKTFELAARTVRGNFRFDGLDSNVVEVGASSVQRFVEQLHYLMDAR